MFKVRKSCIFLSALCTVLCFMSSCGDYYHYKYAVDWLVCIQTSDTVNVVCPVTVYNCQGYPIVSSKELDYKTIEVHADTAFSGHNTTKNWQDFTNIELTVSRLTYNDSVRILFIHNRLIPHDLFIPYSNTETKTYLDINQQSLDSMMNIYSVTLPVDQEQITIPLVVKQR